MVNSQRKAGMMLGYVKSFVFVIVSIFLTPFLIRSLGDAEYGVYQMMSSFAGYLVMINFGTGAVMTRYVSIALEKKDKKSEKNFIALCFILTMGLCAVIVIAALVLYLLIDNIYGASLTEPQLEKAKVLYLYIAGNVVVTLLTQTFQGIITAYEKHIFNNLWQIIRTVLKALIIVALFSVKADSVLIVAVELGLSVCLIMFDALYVLLRLKVRWKLYYFDKEIFATSLMFSLAVFLQAVVQQVNTKVDITILGIMVSPESTTRYSVAMQIFSIFSVVATSAISLYLPEFSRMFANGKPSRKKLNKAMIVPSRIQILASGAVLFGFIICGRDFIDMWMGEGYELSWLIAVIIMVPNFLFYATVIVETALDAMGKRIMRSVILASVALCNVGVSIVLVHFFGEIGAPVGTAITTLIGGVVVMNIYNVKSVGLDLKYFCKNAFRGILPSLLVAFAVSLPLMIFVEIGVLGLFIKGGVFVLVLLVCLLTFGFGKDEKALVKNFFRRKRKS